MPCNDCNIKCDRNKSSQKPFTFFRSSKYICPCKECLVSMACQILCDDFCKLFGGDKSPIYYVDVKGRRYWLERK
jgi:hypothetical protein